MSETIFKAQQFCCLLLAFSCLITLLGLTQVAIFTDTEIQIYGGLHVLTGILSLIILIQIIIRLNRITLFIRHKNSECMLNWKTLFQSIQNNSDFFILRCLLKGFITLLFYSTVIFFTQRNIDNTLIQFQQSYVSAKLGFGISITLFLISVITGFLLQAYFVTQILHMFVNYKLFQNQVIFYFHYKRNFIQENSFKLCVTYQSMIYIKLFAFYCLVKFGIYAYILTINDIDMKVFSSLEILQCATMLIICQRVVKYLKKIYHNLQQNQLNFVTFHRNDQCFTGWFVLVLSILCSKQLDTLKKYFLPIFYFQIIYGLVKFPFYRLNEITQKNIYSLESFIYFDTASSFIIEIWYIVDQISRKIHSVKFLIDCIHKFQFDASNNSQYQINIILPVVDVVEQSLQVTVSQRDDRSKHISKNSMLVNQNTNECCCICLEMIEKDAQIYQAQCHQTHIFHTNCIFEWIKFQNNCPLCKQPLVQ